MDNEDKALLLKVQDILKSKNIKIRNALSLFVGALHEASKPEREPQSSGNDDGGSGQLHE